jgi:hypothetical protein
VPTWRHLRPSCLGAFGVDDDVRADYLGGLASRHCCVIVVRWSLDELQPLVAMPVETFIETSPRSVVSYLMRPILKQIERTFRGR